MNPLLNNWGRAVYKPMTDEQWRKLKALSYCKLRSYDKGFVDCLLKLPIDSPITVKNGAYLEKIWEHYRKQHKYQLAEPYWIHQLAIQKTKLWFDGKTYSQEWYEEMKSDAAHQYCRREMSKGAFK